ncbi:hypothetical protein GCM10011329_18390 [Stakelama pacifica]|nr:hypothetical protein GCM10011329_18390 [Stakelama pacifica]
MRARLLALPLLLLAVPGCGAPDRLPPPNISVSAQDVEAANTPKPAPPASIVTDDAASSLYDAAVEVWGETVSRAWGRICRSMMRQDVEIVCPAGSMKGNSNAGE